MPINVYTGLMRSGKSYEVVSEVIVPAVRQGRRVVTNVDGISEEKIHEYLKAKYPEDDHAAYGRIVHVTNAQVFEPTFFPYYDDDKSAHTDTTVQPGDLVCIDEAWRFWGSSGEKIHKNHKSFFLEHGHFTHEKTGVACDLALMVQDMTTLNRFIKNVIAFNFRTHKKVSLGLNNTYSINMYEGSKQTRAVRIGNWIRVYKKDIFPLYSSFKGGADGKMVNTDARQNVFANRTFWFFSVFLLCFAGFCFYKVYRYFRPVELGKDGKPLVSTATPPAGSDNAVAPSALSKPPERLFSTEWRLSGSYQANGQTWVVLTNGAGLVRLESPSMFQGVGYTRIGEIDGARVTVFSGTAPVQPASLPPPAPSHTTGQK